MESKLGVPALQKTLWQHETICHSSAQYVQFNIVRTSCLSPFWLHLPGFHLSYREILTQFSDISFIEQL